VCLCKCRIDLIILMLTHALFCKKLQGFRNEEGCDMAIPLRQKNQKKKKIPFGRSSAIMPGGLFVRSGMSRYHSYAKQCSETTCIILCDVPG